MDASDTEKTGEKTEEATAQAQGDTTIELSIARGEYREAIGLCARAYGPLVGRTSVVIAGADLAREALVSAFESFPSYRREVPVRAYLFGIVRRECAKRPEPHDPSPLGLLRPSEREALVLRYLAKLSLREVGLVCGIDEAAAKGRVGRALGRLVRESGEKGPEPTCRQIEADLADAVDGNAPGALADHIASCDACRDARHDAARAAALVADAGARYAHPDDFEQKLLEQCTKVAQPKPEAKPAAKTETMAKAPEAPAPARREVPAFLKKRWVWALAAVIAGAIAVIAGRTNREPEAVGGAPWSGRIESVWRASTERSVGLEQRTTSGSWQPAGRADAVLAGNRLRTDGRTRARLLLSDGSTLMVDRDTEIEFMVSRSRTAHLWRGSVVADVVRAPGEPDARFVFAHGHVDVIGTKLSLQASDDRAVVEVSRGSVRLVDSGERSVMVRAGEEGRVIGSGGATLSPASDLAQAMEWSEQEQSDRGDAENLVRGLGELRAKKPGETKERDRAVRLAKHAVKVRVVDNVARTEVDETFANDSGDTLEGIFRFPLPADAQIERLALEVDGKLEEGAFVERDKAAAIWRGVIQHAAPQAPKPKEEIIWVPGPWRDPALLEWQAGGRFELRIFPIPARGTRRIVLAYTETVPPSGGVRRYTYPLAYDPSGSTSVDQFDVDVQVLGHDPSFGVRPRGYELRSEGAGDAQKLTLSASRFVPAGDLSIEYALPDRDTEVTAWAYKPDNGEAPYVAFALRPRLPHWNDERVRDHVIVVDASRSMIGERYARASRLAAAIVREMDPKDRVFVLACDTACQRMSREPDEPGAASAERVARFLDGIVPEGATDLIEAVKAARAAGASRGRSLRVIYIGDGSPSAGPVLPDHITAEVQRLLPSGDSTVTAVPIGADADTTSLAALARGGGGSVVAYVPGQRISSAAISVLAAAYGVALRDASIELPPGLSDVAPARLDPIAAGTETIVVARMAADGREISGDLRLSGKIGTERYEQRFPIRLTATSGKGNAFVPRLFASRRIADLERRSDAAATTDIVALSKRFAVASRHTSLLVLESPAMFRAYGLERSQSPSAWTGEDVADSTTATSDEVLAEQAGNPSGGQPQEQAKADEARASSGYAPSGAGALAGPMPAAPAPAARAKMAAPADMDRTTETKREASAPPRPTIARDDDRPLDEPVFEPPTRPRARMIPMRRVWDRKGQVTGDVAGVHAQDLRAIDAAEKAASQNPDNRTKTADLYRAYVFAGRLDRASDVAEKWSGRDPLDPDALLARAEIAARTGNRERAIRILGSIVDVRPADVVAQTRLVDLYAARGNRDLACAHRIALASLRSSDAPAVAAAVRCAREEGLTDLAERLLASASPGSGRQAIDRELGKTTAAPPLRGDVRLEATWDAGADLDVALVSSTGQRFSWLGAPKGSVTSADPTSQQSEALGLVNLGAGKYVVEVTRADGRRDTIRGTVTARAVGQSRTIPFTLVGDRVEIGQVRVYYESRLVPL